jgi:hypothetical protein
MFPLDFCPNRIPDSPGLDGKTCNGEFSCCWTRGPDASKSVEADAYACACADHVFTCYETSMCPSSQDDAGTEDDAGRADDTGVLYQDPAVCDAAGTGPCPYGCAAVDGYGVEADPDADAGCWSMLRQFGCTPANPPPPAAGGCIREKATGTVYRLSNPYEGWFDDDPAFERCTEADRARSARVGAGC